MSLTPFVPPDFVVPLRLEHPNFVLRPLLITDVVKDYDAVMTSVAELRGIFGPTSDWPGETLCLGCTYIYPSACADCDADAYCWIRSSHAAALDRLLYEAFKTWLESDWPFRHIAFPGRVAATGSRS